MNYYGEEWGSGMSILESLFYGLISGFTEFLPVSSQGHQAILMQLFGAGVRDPLQDIFVHAATLLALLITCNPLFGHMRREQAISQRTRRRRVPARKGLYDLRLIKTAGLPLLAGLLVYILTRKYEASPLFLALFYIINGIILIVPEYMRHGNKDARFLTGWDGIMLGLLGALSAFPGISRVGIMNGYCLSRGADRQQAFNWILVLTLPVLVLFIGFDFYHLFTIGIGAFSISTVLRCLLSGVAAYVGSYFGVVTVRFLTVRTGFTGFAYYSWGVALFSLILYLIA